MTERRAGRQVVKINGWPARPWGTNQQEPGRATCYDNKKQKHLQSPESNLYMVNILVKGRHNLHRRNQVIAYRCVVCRADHANDAITQM